MFRKLIEASWERSKQYRVSQTDLQVPSVSEEEFAKRLEAAGKLIDVVDEFVAPLQKVLKDRRYSLGLTDPDGVVLKVFTCVDNYKYQFQEGKIWSERYVGTTSVGLALSTEKVAFVDFEEHYCDLFKNVMAIAHPILVYGHLVGVLVLAIGAKDGIDYISNLMSLLVTRIEENLLLQESFIASKDGKSLEQVFRTFIHEIKNPLTNIRAFLQLKQLRSDQHSDYDRIITEVDRISEMINNFRYFSVQKDYSLNQIEVGSLLKNLHETLKNMFELKGYPFKLKVSGCCYIVGNENKLKQVFINLIKNAYEALGDEGSVEVSLERRGNQCLVWITDTGEGMSTDELANAFQPFYTTKPSGYGLGLAVCQEIISHHAGQIQVESQKNQGTSIRVQLPCVEEMSLSS